MRPGIGKDLRRSWLAFAAAVLVSALGLAVLHLYGSDAAALQDERAAYLRRQGELPLHEQVQLQSIANARLHSRLMALKEQTGLQAVPPFIAPEQERDPGAYLVAAYQEIKVALDEIARARHVAEYDSAMGFRSVLSEGRKPPASELEHWSKMLQMVTKACYLALHTPLNSIKEIKIEFGGGVSVVETGPPDRPPLMREYPFKLTVLGSLHDVLWLLHELSADQPTSEQRKMLGWLQQVKTKIDVARKLRRDDTVAELGIAPLIVRGLAITSDNLLPDQQLQEIEVSFDLAGMEYLSDQERGTSARRPAASQRAPGAAVAATGQTYRARP